MRSTPAQDALLRARLKEAVDLHAGGSADAFGRKIGYANGGYIRQCLQEFEPRPVRESLIERIQRVPAMRGWFDQILSHISAQDVQAAEKPGRPWPFQRLSPEDWSELDTFEAAVAEDAYLQALDRVRRQSQEAKPAPPSRKQQLVGAP